jgi:hypothetical protein
VVIGEGVLPNRNVESLKRAVDGKVVRNSSLKPVLGEYKVPTPLGRVVVAGAKIAEDKSCEFNPVELIAKADDDVLGNFVVIAGEVEVKDDCGVDKLDRKPSA